MQYVCKEAWVHTGSVMLWFDTHVWPTVWACYGHCGHLSCVLLTADVKFHETWKWHWRIMSTIYQTPMTEFLMPSQTTYYLGSILHLVCLTSLNVNTDWLLHVLLGAQRRLRSLHAGKRLAFEQLPFTPVFHMLYKTYFRANSFVWIWVKIQ